MSGRREHQYSVRVEWAGNLGRGTSSYTAYSRNHVISAAGKHIIDGSSDRVFRGDAARYNPEELLVSSLSACHMLWYLHLCADANITVLEYLDDASGVMVEETDGGGRFKEVTLRPQIVIGAGGDINEASRLHERAHQLCFIASSVNFHVTCEPTIKA